ncbi:MAG: hypothetical protein ACI308_09415 [Muribaculaceae bacterium]
MHILTAYLCGYFSHEKAPDFKALETAGWHKELLRCANEDGVNDGISLEDLHKKRKEELSCIYYPQFTDFCFGEFSGYCQDEAACCLAMEKVINKEIECNEECNTDGGVQRETKQLKFTLCSLHLYFMPNKIMLFAIKVKMQNTSLDTFTCTLAQLRYMRNFMLPYFANFVAEAINPILDVFNYLGGKSDNDTDKYSCFVENGNKLRIFQIVNSIENDMPDDDLQIMHLYQLGTLSKIDDGENVGRLYYERTVRKKRVCVFRNWQALALTDTFTIHAYDVKDSLLSNWEQCYYRMIYVHSLFIKCYLFNLNNRFREVLKSRREHRKPFSFGNEKAMSFDDLVDEFNRFESDCCFHKVSYNFLPLEIDDVIDKGLKINEEKEQLYILLAKEKARSDEENDRRLNVLLTFLSIITLSSTIWDLTSLINETGSISNRAVSNLTVSALVLVAVMFVYMFVYRKRKK